jgi:hypothetical protein
MLFFVTLTEHSHTIWRFIRGYGYRNVPFVKPLTYERLFTSGRAPLGHYIFTDFDRLTHHEIHYAGRMARALRAHDPAIRILNDPPHILERYALLKRLRREGINDFDVTRLEADDRPSRFPVFIRCEDDAQPLDTGLLHSEDELEAALIQLRDQGMPLKRRIAVGFAAEPAADGYYRKYGVICVGNRLVPQHVLRGTDWYVKSGSVPHDAAFDEERLRFFHEFPHGEEIRRVMSLANMQFGRVDYGFVGGRMQVYEINSNPKMPGAGPRPRRRNEPRTAAAEERRRLTIAALASAFEELNTPIAAHGAIAVERPSVRFHSFRRARLGARAEDGLRRLRAMTGL